MFQADSMFLLRQIFKKLDDLMSEPFEVARRFKNHNKSK